MSRLSLSPVAWGALGGYQGALLLAGLGAAGAVPWMSRTSRRIGEGFAHYLGCVPRPPKGPLIWLHGVSLGETNVGAEILAEIRRRHAGWRAAFTTTHPDVMAAARRRGIGDVQAYFPLDLLPAWGRVFRRWKPRLILVTETDFWPGFSACCGWQGVPLILVNGRISEKLCRFYSAVPALAECVLRPFSRLLVQTETDARRLRAMGAEADRIRVLGNVKVDTIPSTGKKNLEPIRKWMGNRPLLVFGSLHPSEFAMLLPLFIELPKSAGCGILIAPRNVSLAGDWLKVLHSRGIAGDLRSALGTSQDGSDVLCLDTLGELAGLYGLACGALVGGSFDPGVGGHNPLEVLHHQTPLAMGPYTRNFADLTGELAAEGGMQVVSDLASARKALQSFLDGGEAIAAQKAAADRVLIRHRGAMGRTLGELEPFLS